MQPLTTCTQGHTCTLVTHPPNHPLCLASFTQPPTARSSESQFTMLNIHAAELSHGAQRLLGQSKAADAQVGVCLGLSAGCVFCGVCVC
jgi:hypothetical protein